MKILIIAIIFIINICNIDIFFANTLKIEDNLKKELIKTNNCSITYYEIIRNFNKTYLNSKYKNYFLWKENLKKRILFLDYIYEMKKNWINIEQVNRVQDYIICQPRGYLDVFIVYQFLNKLNSNYFDKIVDVLNTDKVFYRLGEKKVIEINKSKLIEVGSIDSLMRVLNDIYNANSRIKTTIGESYISIRKEFIYDLVFELKLKSLYSKYRSDIRWHIDSSMVDKKRGDLFSSNDTSKLCEYYYDNNIVELRIKDISDLYGNQMMKNTINLDNIYSHIVNLMVFDYKLKLLKKYRLQNSDRIVFDRKNFINNESYYRGKKYFCNNIKIDNDSIECFYNKNIESYSYYEKYKLSIYVDTSVVDSKKIYNKIIQNNIDSSYIVDLNWDNSLLNISIMKYINNMPIDNVSTPYKIDDKYYIFIKHDQTSKIYFKKDEIYEKLKNDYLNYQFSNFQNELLSTKYNENKEIFSALDSLSYEECAIKSEQLFKYFK